jgi:hypothetical protein
MAAKSGGGAASRRRAKDQAMAAQLRGVVRDTGRCPVCYRIVKNGTHPNPALCNRRDD